MTSLDELLRYEEERPVPRTQTFGRWLAKVVGWSAVGGYLGYRLLRAFGLVIPYPLILFVLVGALLLRRTLTGVVADRLPPTLRRPAAEWSRDERPGPYADGLYLATARWETRLAWMWPTSSPKQFARVVQPRLIEIIDERLRLRHGISRARAPERARAMLGEELWQLVTTPVRRPVPPRELVALIQRIEAL